MLSNAYSQRRMRDDKPSATAYLIARSTCFLSRDPVLGVFVPERSAELNALFVRARRRLNRSLDRLTNSKNFRPLTRTLEQATIPGIKLHYALRKRYLEEIARDALRHGIEQMVVIGAGFDTLALRLHEEFKEVEFFEVDHPATQGVKMRVLEREQRAGKNLHFVAHDLAHRSLAEGQLAEAGYQATKETLFIAEGLLMYLAPAEIELLLQFIQQQSGTNSRFAFTFMERQKDGRIGFHKSSRLVDAWLRLRGESFKWGINRAQVNDYLAPRGFKALDVIAAENLRDRYLSEARLKKISLAEGECICLAAPEQLKGDEGCLS